MIANEYLCQEITGFFQILVHEIWRIYDLLNDYTSLFYSKNFDSSRENKKKYHDFFSTRNWWSLDLAMMTQNQCVGCTEYVNIPEFRLKTSNIGIIERTLEEIPV